MINIIYRLPKHPSKRYGTRSLDQIRMIVVHHFAGNISVEDAAKLHVNDNGWPGIGYHICVQFSGILATNDLRTISYHCGGHNTKSVGIALQGDYSREMPPDEMLESLIGAIDTVRWAVGRNIPVYPHSTFRPTDCPGQPLREFLKEVFPAPLPLVSNSYWLPEHPDYIANDDDYKRPNQP